TVVEECIDLLGAAGAVDATSADSPGFDGPHMVDASIICGRCHGINGQPGGHLGLLEGQNVLCMSCHSAGGQALQKPLHELDPADPYATNPAVPDSQGRSHAWGVPATSTAADSVGPAAGSPMGDHLDNGLIKCSTCHEQHNSDADAPYLRRRNDQDQMCKECHAPRNEGLGERGTHPVGFAYPAGQGEFPLAGDVGPLFIKNGRVECMTCHALHNADSGGANGGQGDGMLLRAANDETLCQTCHREHNGHTPSGSWQPTCNDCHQAHDPDNENLSLVALTVHNQTLDAQMPVTFTSRTGANSFDDGDPAVNDGICQVCHTATAYHRYDGTGGAHNDGAVCTSCHPHSAGFMPAGGASCIACHSSPQDNGDNVPPGGRHAVVNADGTGGHHLAGGVLTDTDCVICHEMSQHRQGTVRLWTDPNNPTTPLPLTGDPNELVPFCTNCHDSLTHPTVHTTGATWEPVCTQCHEVHDPANGNLSLVNDVVRNETLGVDRPVVFTSRTGANSFDDGDPAVNDGICQVCHTATAHHLYDGTSAPHNDGADCTACHPHQSGFLPTNASCQDCHAVSQGTRRPVVAEFSRASHHLQGGLLDDADCEVCHDMSQHQGGSVRLKNVDDPANPAAVTVLTGNPATDSTEAVKLEAFCLACHDNNGANGVAPFTDGIMPAPIDATLWASGSHQVGPMTCFGDGQTFGCHDTGHGSNKQKLLAPSTVAPTPPANAEEQEGFCYTCHDADGPASTDIESLFVLSSHHNVTFADQADGSKVECTNCHNPHTASSTALLADPDTGDPWTGIGPGFCLACHDGAPPQGVTFPSGSTGSGFDKSGFVGTTHATNLGGNTCRHCHMDHGSTYASLLRDQYVTTDYNQHTLGDGDYAVCWICHDESATIEQTNAFKNLHKRHVDGARGPCIICHDVHGGFDSGEPGLINFENSVQNGYDILFIDGRDASSAFYLNAAQDAGNCYLKCHNKNHNPKTYPRTPNPLVDCSACHVP
ncbi:MAG: cytochrome c3 family protein, partial [Phycisphaerae bacterium]